MDNIAIGRRSARRHTISVPGSYRTGAGEPRVVELWDVSEEGCRFQDRANRLYVGTRLTIKVGDIGPIDATVAWIDNTMVGLQFCQALYEPLLAHLRTTGSPPRGVLERRRSWRT